MVETIRPFLGYVLLPRPLELVKWAFVPGAYVVGWASYGAQKEWSWLELGLIVLVFEYLIYMARYQLNDVRGIAHDMPDPQAHARRRLPALRGSIASAVKVSLAAALVRIVAATYLIMTSLGHLTECLVIAGLAVFGIATVYETARSREQRRSRRSGWMYFLIFWVGSGYALRVGLGLVAGAGGPLPPEQLLVVITGAWAFGVAFVSMTWVLEGTKDLRGVSGKPHVTWLYRYARWTWTTPRDGASDAIKWKVLGSGGTRQLGTPWTLATLIACVAFSLFAADVLSLSQSKTWVLVAIAAGHVVLEAMLPTPLRAVMVVPFFVAAVSLGGFHVVSTVPVLTLGTFVAFSESSLYNLQFGVQDLILSIGNLAMRVGGLVATLVVGKEAMAAMREESRDPRTRHHP